MALVMTRNSIGFISQGHFVTMTISALSLLLTGSRSRPAGSNSS